MIMPENTQKPAEPKVPTLEERIKALDPKGGIDGVEKAIAYLRTIRFAVTTAALDAVKHETKLTADEVESVLFEIQENDELEQAECVAKLFAQGVVARKRSIDYAAENKRAKAVADSQMRYNRWASANAKLAANPLTNLPVMLSYGLISQDLFKAMMAAANEALETNPKVTVA
jgi:hypothetical protein